AGARLPGGCWSVRMVDHLDGEVLLRLSLLEGLALHAAGDDLWRLVIILVDQALQALQCRLDGLYCVVTAGRLPTRPGTRMHGEVPYRPLTGGAFGAGALHGAPQPLIRCPLRWLLGGIPLCHIRQRLPGLPRRQQRPQGLAMLVLER